MLKPLTMWITRSGGKFLKWMGVPDHLTCLLRSLYAGQEATIRTSYGKKKKKKIGSKVRREYDKAVYCHPAYLA